MEGQNKRDASEEARGTDDEDKKRKKRVKKAVGKACVYCRRSHMVCEGGRPCERCIKRNIPHLCRDFTPPRQLEPPHGPQPPQSQAQVRSEPDSSTASGSASTQMPLYSDANFPPSWPLLTDDGGQAGYGEVKGDGEWGKEDDTELGALSKFLGDLGVPNLPGGFLDVLSYFSNKGGANNLAGVPLQGYNTGTATPDAPMLGQMDGEDQHQLDLMAGLNERYFLAAADQPSGPRSSRLAQVIKAKYDAGLLKPYDYVKGYERMKGWMDSGRANPRAESVPASAPGSPRQGAGAAGRAGMKPLTAVNSSTPQSVSVTSKGISADSRRRIWAAMNGFRPKFRQIARTLDEVDLVFIEEAMERWMLQYDRAFASIHTPSCIWRRTGEIQKANQEFANLTGIPASMFRNGQLCVYELMDEDSAVRYWEGYAKIAFDAGQRSLYTSCTLKIPTSLTRLPPRQPFSTPPLFGLPKTAAPGPSGLSHPSLSAVPDLSLPQSLINTANGAVGAGGMAAMGSAEVYREIKCCFSVTIRRDAWGVPVAIMGQWIVSYPRR
ncbi:uncharacterized protein MKK02DRAFT_23232 [Dioszegia hungarica]|uniref:Zn(2)-C6 fungal-type domain-containing protein n=1 Tax=Dioszegia hungarica TaxID=4972 RepID=A0AA38LXC9_9TREE|nr:uncharacterized protein MKK02DRAFT_23232 [Dioszegia hungarica]KAI9637874.1 hypothetical protein MKK02DRAFT_23232 [Dioszegia hungarica]